MSCIITVMTKKWFKFDISSLPMTSGLWQLLSSMFLSPFMLLSPTLYVCVFVCVSLCWLNSVVESTSQYSWSNNPRQKEVPSVFMWVYVWVCVCMCVGIHVCRRAGLIMLWCLSSDKVGRINVSPVAHVYKHKHTWTCTYTTCAHIKLTRLQIKHMCYNNNRSACK